MASRPSDITTAFETPYQLPAEGAEAPATLGWTDSIVWSNAWKANRSGEDWGLNQQRYMSSAIEQIAGELKKRGHRVYAPTVSPASVASRNMRGKPRVLPRARKGDALWRDEQFYAALTAEQAKDPGFLPEYSGVRDWEGLYQYAIGKRQGDSAAADKILSRASGGARLGTSLITGLGSALTDPTSYVPIPGAGPSATVGRTILANGAREAGANILVGAAMEPFVRADAKAIGRERDLGDTLLDLGIQGGAGFVIGGLGGAAHHYTGKRATDRATVDAFRSSVPEENWTPTERAAVNVMERDIDIAEASPYLPNRKGDAAHLDQMADSLGLSLTMTADPPPVVRRAALDPDAQFRAPAAETFMARVRSAESSGNDTAKALTSSAYGRYQFTQGTWLSYFKRRYPSTGMTDADILAKRRDGSLQDLLMRDLTEDNSRRLQQAGVEITPASLYAAHFAGPADAVRILTADRATPLESVMNARSIAANQWLRGKSVGEFLAIMDRKMGGEGHMPAVREPVTPEEIADALDADPPLRRPADHEADPDGLMDSDYPQLDPSRFSSSEEHARAQLRDFANADAREGFDSPDLRGEQWRRIAEEIPHQRHGDISGAFDHPEMGAIDMRWGGSEENSLSSQSMRELAEALSRNPEIVERLPDLIERMEVVERQANRAVLASHDGRMEAALDWDSDARRWRLSSLARDETPSPADRTSSQTQRAAQRNAPPGNPAHFRNFIDRQARTSGWVVAPKLTPELRERGFVRAIPARKFKDMRADWDAMPPDFRENFADDPFATMEDVDLPAIEPLSSEARAITESLEHDLRMAMEDPAVATMLIHDESGEPRTVAQIMDEIDEDDDARAALIACMKPAKKGA